MTTPIINFRQTHICLIHNVYRFEEWMLQEYLKEKFEREYQINGVKFPLLIKNLVLIINF